MNKPMFFVFYNDGHYENGGVGFEAFDDSDSVSEFILSRMAQDNERSIDNYTVVYGKQIDIEITEVVSKIKLQGW